MMLSVHVKNVLFDKLSNLHIFIEILFMPMSTSNVTQQQISSISKRLGCCLYHDFTNFYNPFCNKKSTCYHIPTRNQDTPREIRTPHAKLVQIPTRNFFLMYTFPDGVPFEQPRQWQTGRLAVRSLAASPSAMLLYLWSFQVVWLLQTTINII